jgi:catechol 2,3-dioxygenase-like lactoylglutathione lyase family enzyme
MSNSNDRPPMWIGHVSIAVPDVARSKNFFMALGMRDIGPFDDFAILEMRAGTHLIIEKATGSIETGASASFDLMVDDIETTHARLKDTGLQPTDIESNSVHSYFTVTEPGGHQLLFNSSHNTGQPV